MARRRTRGALSRYHQLRVGLVSVFPSFPTGLGVISVVTSVSVLLGYISGHGYIPSTPQFPNTMLTPTILNPLRLPFASNSRRLARSVISARSMAGLAPSKKAVDPVVLPEMQLSNHDNPLTAPISLKDTPIAERAAKRFAVHGNAIGTHLSTF